MTRTSSIKSMLVLGVMAFLITGCTLLSTCDLDTYAEMVLPNLRDMVDTGEKVRQAQDAGDIELVKQWRTQYQLYYNALKVAPTTWCTQQLHQEFLLSSEAYLNSVDLWLEGNYAGAASMLEKANQHWNEGWKAYERASGK